MDLATWRQHTQTHLSLNQSGVALLLSSHCHHGAPDSPQFTQVPNLHTAGPSSPHSHAQEDGWATCLLTPSDNLPHRVAGWYLIFPHMSPANSSSPHLTCLVAQALAKVSLDTYLYVFSLLCRPWHYLVLRTRLIGGRDEQVRAPAVLFVSSVRWVLSYPEWVSEPQAQRFWFSVDLEWHPGICFCFFFLAALHVGFYHWTAREVPGICILKATGSPLIILGWTLIFWFCGLGHVNLLISVFFSENGKN